MNEAEQQYAKLRILEGAVSQSVVLLKANQPDNALKILEAANATPPKPTPCCEHRDDCWVYALSDDKEETT